jgi:hypothetical protein
MWRRRTRFGEEEECFLLLLPQCWAQVLACVAAKNKSSREVLLRCLLQVLSCVLAIASNFVLHTKCVCVCVCVCVYNIHTYTHTCMHTKHTTHTESTHARTHTHTYDR